MEQTSTILTVVVTDEDDHPPVFNRQRNSVPLEIETMEEVRVGTLIGNVTAVDKDLGENAVVEYAIVDGNDRKIFRSGHTVYLFLTIFSHINTRQLTL